MHMFNILLPSPDVWLRTKGSFRAGTVTSSRQLVVYTQSARWGERFLGQAPSVSCDARTSALISSVLHGHMLIRGAGKRESTLRPSNSFSAHGR
jgi:hypothetical protein